MEAGAGAEASGHGLKQGQDSGVGAGAEAELLGKYLVILLNWRTCFLCFFSSWHFLIVLIEVPE